MQLASQYRGTHMNKEQEAIIESLIYVKEQMKDKNLSQILSDKYIKYLNNKYPNEDTSKMIKKYKRALRRK